MRPADLTGILLLAFLGGGIVTFLGAIIKYFNAGDILNLFDEKNMIRIKYLRLLEETF